MLAGDVVVKCESSSTADKLASAPAMLTALGIAALIALVIASFLVLRVKSDPMEKEEIRNHLADRKTSKPKTDSTHSG